MDIYGVVTNMLHEIGCPVAISLNYFRLILIAFGEDGTHPLTSSSSPGKTSLLSDNQVILCSVRIGIHMCWWRRWKHSHHKYFLSNVYDFGCIIVYKLLDILFFKYLTWYHHIKVLVKGKQINILKNSPGTDAWKYPTQRWLIYKLELLFSCLLSYFWLCDCIFRLDLSNVTISCSCWV